MSSKPAGKTKSGSKAMIMYSPQVAEVILADLARGRPLKAICQVPDMPIAQTVRAWVRRYVEFGTKYREVRKDLRVGKVLGKPESYDSGTAERLCERVVEGQCLQDVCQADNMPAQATVFRWLRHEPEFREMFAVVRELRGLSAIDEICEIADATTKETLTVDKVRIGARQLLLVKPTALKSPIAEADQKPIINVEVVRFGHQNKDN